MIDLIIVISGIVMSGILFFRFPLIEKRGKQIQSFKVSVIIPARNEEGSLPLLLGDLGRQKYPLHEIICIDDNSTDETMKVILAHEGVTLISLKEKPVDWMGKSWAAQKGAESATGTLLLFLDADVRMEEDGIERILRLYEANPMTISVQPYHCMERTYEELSFFFNMIQVAANGLTLPFRNRRSGLYGPVILIKRADYFFAGGHEAVRSEIIDDVVLAERLREKKIPYRSYIGDRGITYRMYPGGLGELFQGWIKNQASGALKTPVWMILMVFLWITATASTVIQVGISIFTEQMDKTMIFMFLYGIWVVIYWRNAGYLGNFHKRTCIFYPVFLAVFIWVFVLSLVKKTFRLKVTWKDREIRLGK